MNRSAYAVPVTGLRGVPFTMPMDDTLSVNVRRTDTAGTAESVRIKSNVYVPAVVGAPARSVAPCRKFGRFKSVTTSRMPGGNEEPAATAQL